MGELEVVILSDFLLQIGILCIVMDVFSLRMSARRTQSLNWRPGSTSPFEV